MAGTYMTCCEMKCDKGNFGTSCARHAFASSDLEAVQTGSDAEAWAKDHAGQWIRYGVFRTQIRSECGAVDPVWRFPNSNTQRMLSCWKWPPSPQYRASTCMPQTVRTLHGGVGRDRIDVAGRNPPTVRNQIQETAILATNHSDDLSTTVCTSKYKNLIRVCLQCPSGTDGGGHAVLLSGGIRNSSELRQSYGASSSRY
eukprot:2874745-Rhodomonas_salina.1